MTDGINTQMPGGVGGILPALPKANETTAPAGASFRETLYEKINQVNSLQKEAESAVSDLVTGKTENMSEVFVAVQKADLAFKTLMQIRNKLFDAYQEINQLRI